MPAAAFAEMALAAGSEALGLPVQGCGVSRLEVEQMLALDGRTELTTQLVRGEDDGFMSRSIRARPGVIGVGMRWPASMVQRDVAIERFGALGRPGLWCHRLTSTPPCGAPVPIMGRRLPR